MVKAVGVPMLLMRLISPKDSSGVRSPGNYFLSPGSRLIWDESVAVLEHEAAEHRSLLFAAHHPMLASNQPC